MTSPVSAVEAIEQAMERVTNKVVWSVEGYDEPTGQMNVISDGFFIAGVIANQPDQEATAAYIAACNPVAMREVLALARQAEALKRENAELRAFAASFKLTCVESSFYKDCYLHISEPDSVSFRLGNGSQFSKFIAGLEDRRARALLGGENAK